MSDWLNQQWTTLLGIVARGDVDLLVYRIGPAILLAGLVVGLVIGYGLRAGISRRRRKRARLGW